MAFTRITDGQRKLIRLQDQLEDFQERGWTLSPFISPRLRELDIPFEILGAGKTEHDLNAVIYAPAWVRGIWLNLDTPRAEILRRWDIVKVLLMSARDSRPEQEMVCAEMALNVRVPREERRAARNFLASLHARDERRSDESAAED